VRTDHSSWQQMPRRMLRHRVIQQCARLALAISANERTSKLDVTKQTNNIELELPTNIQFKKRTEVLKEKLSI